MIRREPPDDTPFGARLRRLVSEVLGAGGPAGLVVLGAGSIPLATRRRPAGPRRCGRRGDRRAPWPTSATPRTCSPSPAPTSSWPTCPSSSTRTTHCRAGWRSEPASRCATSGRGAGWRWTSTRRWTCCSSRRDGSAPPPASRTTRPRRPSVSRLAALRSSPRDPGAELLVAGRMSSADLRWLERSTRSRTRAWIEERGLRTATAGALVGRSNRRPPRSVLGELLDRDGPGSLGRRPRRDGGRRDRRHAGPARAPAGRRRWRLADGRGPVRERPAAGGPGPGPVAGRRSRRPRPRRRSRSCSAGTGWSGPAPAWRWAAAVGRGAAAGADDALDGARVPGRDPARPRGRRRGRGAGRGDPRRDRARRPDHLRAVHGARPVRAGPRLLPPPRCRARARRRLPHRPGGAPDLRRRGRAAGRAGLGRAREAVPVHAHGARRRDRARSRPDCWAACATPARRCSRRVRYRPVEVEPARTADAPAGAWPADGLARHLADEDAPADRVETGAVVANEVLDALPVHRVDRPSRRPARAAGGRGRGRTARRGRGRARRPRRWRTAWPPRA